MEYGPGNSPLKTVTYPGRTFGRKPSCLLANRRTQKQPLAVPPPKAAGRTTINLLRQFGDGDYVVLLDERGDEYRSIDFAYWLQKRMASGIRRLVMVIGGPYGFSDEVYARADTKLSLSKMTFSHQIVRAIFAEQIYRAFTILNNEPYHHE